jgi:uncharacterized membrane protein YkvA (DUF1232 family)
MPSSESPDGNALERLEGRLRSGDAPDPLPVLTDAASRVLQRRFRVVLLIRNAYERMLAHSDVLSAVWQDLKTMLRLLIRWVDRSYQRVSWTPLLLIVGALLYFVVPLDVVPDALGALGFVDDVTVISTVVQQVRHELDRFRQWENTKSLPE